MSNKTEIIVCLGSSCFARGNKKTVQEIDSYIKVNKLEEKVYFHGGHCFGKCEKGPILKVNDKYFEKIDPASVIDILAKEMNE